MDSTVEIVSVCVFLFTVGLFYLLSRGLDREGRKTEARVREFSNERKVEQQDSLDWLSARLVGLGRSLVDSSESSNLRKRLKNAGYYNNINKAASIFRGSQAALAGLLFVVGGILPWIFGMLTIYQALGASLGCLAVGFIVPGLILDNITKRRSVELRQAWPDALDMMVLCLEGGLSLSGTIHRVCEEMNAVHPTLGEELLIFQGEMNFGRSAGEALMNMGERTSLEEVCDLATIFLQSEQYGVSITKAIRLHSESCRHERHMNAEEKAQKAAVQILFPTLLCIFPAIFIVILGPAAYQIAEMFK